MPVDLVIAATGEVVFTNRHKFTPSKWYNFICCCRIMMRKRGECPLIVFLNILLSVLDDLRSLRHHDAIFRIQSSNPGSAMIVPSVVVRGDDLFNLLFGVLIDTLGRCRGGKTDGNDG